MTTTKPPYLRQNAPAHDILALIGLLLICYAVAGVGAIVTAPTIPTWYATLAKPGFTPPSTIFGPVWTALYGLMAIAAWLVWRTPRTTTRFAYRIPALILFAVQLMLNALWTPVFFYLHLVLVALIMIVCLWFAILFTMLYFWRVDRFAAALMLPYLAWITFAAALNYAIYRLN